MWFIFIAARLFIFLSFQPHLTVTLLRSCSVVNNPTRRMGLSPMFKPASSAQAPFPPVRLARFYLFVPIFLTEVFLRSLSPLKFPRQPLRAQDPRGQGGRPEAVVDIHDRDA